MIAPDLDTPIHIEQPSPQVQKRYILSEGQGDEKRLDFQHTLFKDLFVEAFKTARSFKDMTGACVLDFGCGNASTSSYLQELVTKAGHYIGVDVSEHQLTKARDKAPEAFFIHGDENSAEGQKALSQADFVYMRFVVMHQKHPQAFIEKVYSHLKPGAVLILQEPEGPEERKQEMRAQYPGSDILSDFKLTLGRGLGLDYDFARHLEPILTEMGPQKIVHQEEKVYIPTRMARRLHKQNLKSVSERALNLGIFTHEYLQAYSDAVSKLPTEGSHFWWMDTLHTFVLMK